MPRQAIELPGVGSARELGKHAIGKARATKRVACGARGRLALPWIVYV